MRRYLFLGIILAVLACKKDGFETPAALTSFFPASGEVTGWTREGALDTVYDSTALSALIGSSAQPYVSNGFVGFGRQYYAATLAGSARRLELRIADMHDTTNAAAVYSALAGAGQVEWTGDNPGRAARIRQDSVSCEVDFWLRNYHAWLRVDSGSAVAVEAARFFALAVAHKVDSTEPAPTQPKDVVELVPLSDEISGWTRTGNMDVCETPDQLYALIDGEGQPYIDNGFLKCAFQSYTGNVAGNPIQLDLRIFDQTDSTHCSATFDAVATGSEIPWTGDNPGREARIEQSLFAYKVDFWDGRYYVWVTIQNNTEAGLSVAKLIAMNVDAAIHARLCW